MILDLFLQYQDEFEHLKQENLSDYVCFDIENIVENLTAIISQDNIKEYDEQFTFNIRLPYPKTAFVYGHDWWEHPLESTKGKFCGRILSLILCEENITGKAWWKKTYISISYYIITKSEKFALHDPFWRAVHHGKEIDCEESPKDIIKINKKYGIEKLYHGKNNSSNEKLEKSTKPVYLIELRCTEILCALQILNCKNVEQIKHSLPHRQQLKQTHRKSYNEYYTLKVPSLYYPKHRENLGLWQQRLHACRGHFKIYTRSNPLLGKHIGTYWWGSQIRGHRELGTIQKQYKVILNKEKDKL